MTKQVPTKRGPLELKRVFGSEGLYYRYRDAMSDRSSIMSSVHAAEMHHLKECFASPRDSETVCESPLCDNRFQQTGLKIEPRRFCSDQCRQQASLIRRVGALLNDLPDQEVIRILRSREIYK
jgi:hypothetical protein